MFSQIYKIMHYCVENIMSINNVNLIQYRKSFTITIHFCLAIRSTSHNASMQLCRQNKNMKFVVIMSAGLFHFGLNIIVKKYSENKRKKMKNETKSIKGNM
ncbi:hypothetical protein LOAG_11779, partial [Loa loa]